MSAVINSNHSDREAFAIRKMVSQARNSKIVTVIGLLTLWIAGVSAYDVYLTIAYADTLLDLESNPVARMVMHLDEGTFQRQDLATFIGLKCAGTAVVVVTLFLIAAYRRSTAILAASGVAIFQLLLLGFLTMR